MTSRNTISPSEYPIHVDSRRSRWTKGPPPRFIRQVARELKPQMLACGVSTGTAARRSHIAIGQQADV